MSQRAIDAWIQRTCVSALQLTAAMKYVFTSTSSDITDTRLASQVKQGTPMRVTSLVGFSFTSLVRQNPTDQVRCWWSTLEPLWYGMYPILDHESIYGPSGHMSFAGVYLLGTLGRRHV
jgi:hypothetical protein